MALTSLQVALPQAAPTAWRRRRPPRRFVATASGSGGGGPPPFQRLREQLLQLHAEADHTQSKANSARVRLVRLTEAAENLKKRAAASVRMGKENEAVDLLVQKKKLTRALESLKQRIEVLDKLSAKISEAISAKQNMLIEHALHPEALNGEDSNDQIRVFSGKVDEGADGASNSLPKSVGKDYFEMKNVKVHGDMAEHFEQSVLQMDERFAFSKDHDQTKSIKKPSVYNAFLEHIDSQLKSLEYEIEQFVSSQLVEGMGVQKQINNEQQILSDILKHVTETRERIASILNKTVNGTGAEDLR